MPITLLPARDTRTLGGAAAAPPDETKLDRLLKMLPSDVLLFYPAAVALTSTIPWAYYQLLMVAIGLAAIIINLHRDAKANKLPDDWRQYLVRCAAFVAWALFVSTPLAPFARWIPPQTVHQVASLAAVLVPLLGFVLLPRAPSSKE
jgi:hypothetical protein